MKSITLHTAYRRKTKAGVVFADAGETLAVGDEISTEDADDLVARGGAVDPDVAAAEEAAVAEVPAKARK